MTIRTDLLRTAIQTSAYIAALALGSVILGATMTALFSLLDMLL